MNNPAQKSYQLYIGGEWVDASDGGTLDVYCPANGEQLSVIADATKEDVARAGAAAGGAVGTRSTLLGRRSKPGARPRRPSALLS